MVSKGGKDVTRIIALEEHYSAPVFTRDKNKQVGGSHPYVENEEELNSKLSEVGERRVADMDAAGIDIQVLSLSGPGTEQLEPAEAVGSAIEANNFVARAIEKFPSRLAAFAALPTSVPDKAADELERAVKKFGFKGAMFKGHVRGRYLDDRFFWPIFERAESLNVPIYIHPTVPPEPVIDTYYVGNFPPAASFRFARAAWGWHIETATHVLRLILSGVFDQYPKLQVIIGHLGEGLPFMIDRLEQNLPTHLTKLNRTVSAYLRENIYYTISGFNYVPVFLNLLFQVGVDRIMFSADYPYSSMEEALTFLKNLPISPANKEQIAHCNTEKLMRF